MNRLSFGGLRFGGFRAGAVALGLAIAAAPSAWAEPADGFFTASDGIKIHYLTEGESGSWVMLVHGYTDSARRMFARTGIMEALAGEHRVVAIDNRNHGESDKPEPNGAGRAEDVLELMDHLGIEKAHIHGYSMGGGITARLMASHPERFITAALGGSGIRESDAELAEQAAALDPERPEPRGAEARAFRNLRQRAASRRQGEAGEAGEAREGRGEARRARRRRPALEIDLGSIDFPVLAINGEYDRPFSKTQRMWRELSNFQNVVLAGKNHMSAIAVGGPMPPEYVEALVTFIDANDVVE